MKEQWRQQMQQKMADYKQPAPEVSWDALDKALASNRHKAKTVPMWTRRIAAAVVALMVVTGGYLAFHHEDAPVINKEEAVSSLSEKTAEEPRTAEPQQTNGEPATLLAHSHGDRHLGKPQEPVPMTEPLNIPENTPQEEQTIQEPQQSPIQEMQESQESQEAHETHETKTVVATVKRQTLDEPYEIRKQKTPENRLMAMVYLSNGLSGDNLTTYTGDYKGEYYKDAASSYQSYNTKVYGESVNHRQPVRLGLSLRYRLNDRWSIESGLAYTRLRSEYKQNDIAPQAYTEQTLSYIGIPVTASYLLTRGRYVNLYVSAGGMVEKMVKGRLHHEYTGQYQDYTESVSIRPLQFSVNSGLGVEFNLGHLFSLYAEPGVGYYFDNGSDIPTYYQDKPFSFNLNLGIRFNIK